MPLALALLLAAPPAPADAPLRAVAFVDAKEGWAAGDGGLVLHTIDGGATWEPQPTGTRASLRGLCFLSPYTGFAVGRTELPNRAGSVGVVLGTADGGNTWTELTGSLLPGLNAVKFFDEQRGVVVGDGSDAFPSGVFSTADGGKSWAMLPGPRAGSWARLNFTSPTEGELLDPTRGRPDRVAGGRVVGPVELGSAPPPQWTWQEAGFRGPDPLLVEAVATVGPDAWAVGQFGGVWKQSGGPTAPKRLVRAGGQRAAVLFAFEKAADVPLAAVTALAAEGYLCAAFALDADAEFRLPAAMRQCGGVGATAGIFAGERGPQLAEAIRRWQPEVIVTDTPELVAAAGVKKVYAPTDASGAAVTLTLTAFSPTHADALKYAVEPAAFLFGPRPVPDALHFKLARSTLPGADRHKSFMDGIDLEPGGTARRLKADVTVDAATLADREKAVAVRRGMEKRLADPAAVGGVEPMLVATVTDLAALPAEIAARAAVRLGFRLADSGHWTAARELFAVAADKYPEYPDSVEAVRWLIRYQASGEVRRRIELGHFPVFQKGAFAPEADLPKYLQAGHTDLVPTKPAYRFRSPEARRQWSQAAVDPLPKLAAFGAAYTRDPGTALCVAAAYRQLGMNARAADLLVALVADCSPEWQAKIGEELRLLGRPGDWPRLAAAECRFTAAKPYLDGRLNDACWTNAPAMTGPTLGDRTTTARFACDGQFLYVAVSCTRPAAEAVAAETSRRYDADVTTTDHIEVCLDLDRDGATAYRLRVDQRGRVADECWGDGNWNPKWFVAAETTATGWAIETAVPLAELTGEPPVPGQPWGLRLARVTPGTGARAVEGLLHFRPGQ